MVGRTFDDLPSENSDLGFADMLLGSISPQSSSIGGEHQSESGDKTLNGRIEVNERDVRLFTQSKIEGGAWYSLPKVYSFIELSSCQKEQHHADDTIFL